MKNGEDKKELTIAIDPGFDGCKICVNGSWWANVPFIAAKSDEVQYEAIANDEDNYIYYCSEKGKYLVGAFVKKGLFVERDETTSDKYKIEQFYDIHERFTSTDFKVVFEAVIGYALINWSKVSDFKLSKMQDYDIKIAIALPDEHVASVWDDIKDMVNSNHEFDLTIGLQKPVTINFTPASAFAVSQALCTFIDLLLDENGSNRYDVNEIAPAVVILAGYKTLERFEYTASRGIVVGNDKNSSNEKYAMLNINKKVSDRVKSELHGVADEESLKNITPYKIESSLFAGETELYVPAKKKDGERAMLQRVPIAKYREEALKEVCAEMIDDTQRNFNYFASTKSILVAGGTGSLYYKYVADWCAEDEILRDKCKCILVEGEMAGKKYEPVFSVAIGLWKFMNFR